MATDVLTPNGTLADFGSPDQVTLVGLFVLSNRLPHSDPPITTRAIWGRRQRRFLRSEESPLDRCRSW